MRNNSQSSLKGPCRYLYIFLIWVTVAPLLMACSPEDIPAKQEVMIGFAVDQVASRSTIFSDYASLLNPEIGGGDFSVYAYICPGSSNAGKCYLHKTRVNYFVDANDWRFTDASGKYINHYWPGNEKLNFFAHMPYNAAEAGVSSISYINGKGTVFEYSLPLASYDPELAQNADLVAAGVPNQENLREFIFAYAENQDINTQNADKENPGVKLIFNHPFAAINFKLGESYRMTLNSITLSQIQHSGTYEYDNGWIHNPDLESDDLVIHVEKGVPHPINFRSPIGGPYLVSPQELSDESEILIKYTRLDAVQATARVRLKNLTDTWEAGHKYTYTINLGKTEEEILFKVEVEKWIINDFKNEITVE